MRNDRQNVGEHDQEAGNVYITYPSSVVRRLSFLACHPSSVVRRPSFAFTLIELMVVVAIISLLLMMLVPNIRTVREKAWSANCQNNLRQYGIAMNQYLADNDGYFIYPGAGGKRMVVGYAVGEQGLEAQHPGGLAGRNTQSGSAREYWIDMIPAYIPANVTIQSLAAGESSVRVCPAVLRQIRKDGNFFDPDAPNFKGFGTETMGGVEVEKADFELRIGGTNEGYDADNKLNLDPSFTTYAINPDKLYQPSSNCPANTIAFIDWNAREGWWATLSNTPPTTWMFNGTNSQGVAVSIGDKKRSDDAWWLTEVGFHHLNGNVYGANYVAMDGHVGWIGSNAISRTNFTTGLK